VLIDDLKVPGILLVARLHRSSDFDEFGAVLVRPREFINSL